MTDEEFRQIMKAGGWSEEEIEDRLSKFYKWKKIDHSLTFERWLIPKKPSILWARSHRETDNPE